MSRIGYKITLQSATLLASGPVTGNLLKTLEFIPGNTVRGVLARRYLELRGNRADTPQFRQLFLEERVRYGFAYLEGAQPIPLSARSCKYHGGFTRDDNDNHGLLDLLRVKQGEILNCPQCGKAVDYFPGYWDAVEYRKHAPRTRLITRTAIDARLGAAKTGFLYTQKVLEEGQTFYGAIETDSGDLAHKLKELLNKPFSARIGTGGSRGQGWVDVSKADPLRQMPWGSSRQRYQQYWDLYKDAVLVVTLLSDALFTDEYLRDTTRFPLESLGAHGIDPEQWQAAPDKAYTETRLIHGFDGKPIHLPRAPRLAVKAGSVYLFRAKPEAAASLKIPPGDGLVWIGELNGEGYGQAVLWHPFHCQPDRPDRKQNAAAVAATVSSPAPWLLNARAVFLQGGYQRISAAQMAALDDCIARAATLEDANGAVAKFLDQQLTKLQKKQDRGQPPTSWQLPLTAAQSNETTLGSRLLCWFREKQYRTSADANEDGLELLRRAWGAFYGLYCYHLEMGKPMALCPTPLEP